MRNKGWTLGIIVLASLAFVAVALALVATPAHASITGTPLPSYGNDWNITQDTTVLGESIKLQGDIIVNPGVTLKIRNTEVKFNSSSMGEHGIFIDSDSSSGDGVVELDDCTIRSDYDDYGWYCEVWGSLKITKARLYNVEDGIWVYSDNVDIANMTLYAQGRYGMNILHGDPKIVDSDIFAKGYSGSTVTGIRLFGNSSDRAAPTFKGVTLKVYRNDDIYSTSSSTYINFNMIGLDSYYGQFTKLEGLEIHFEATADVMVNYTGGPRVYAYFDALGIYLGGGTILGGMDITISGSLYHIDA
ncbi:MAG: hypothetical protein GWN18_12945, partial [Thermoplasmata archaeon]|nr:hypothetical protein [Thermoplasmata archaeon]NIS12962.1 hypothetical protein [Thermoplasmata archaeon]NIS20870.1 hypothetical protein [Thermoplasmata archaeon]NIT78290.1 hypothetical protein [Thermoplasmata archaeon]NIU49926.1 hypothetical protein [Thermoplasmata archaeon]